MHTYEHKKAMLSLVSLSNMEDLQCSGGDLLSLSDDMWRNATHFSQVPDKVLLRPDKERDEVSAWHDGKPLLHMNVF